MPRLLDQPVQPRRDPACASPARRLGEIHPAHQLGPVPTCPQRFLHARPVPLEPVLEFGPRAAIDPGGAFVLDPSWVRRPQVAAFDPRFHQRVLRFRLLAGRRAHLSTRAAIDGLPVPLHHPGPPCGSFCLIGSLRDHPSYSRSRCSALRPCGRLWPLLTSGGASEDLSIPVAPRHTA